MLSATALRAAMKKLPLHAITAIYETLYREHVAAHGDADGSPILAVDGPKVRLAPALAKHCFRPQRTSGANPLALFTVMYDVCRGMIASMDISSSFDERAALQRLIRRGAEAQGATLLADRGYFSRELWVEMHEAGILALFPVRRNAARFVVDFLESSAFAAHGASLPVCSGGAPPTMALWSLPHPLARSPPLAGLVKM